MLDIVIAAQRRILDRLIEWEGLISRLYTRYAERFPEHRELWLDMAAEEVGHAEALREIHALIGQGAVLENIGEFKEDLVEHEIVLIRAALERCDEPGLTITEAADVARSIETSIIESLFYDAIECCAPRFHEIAERLRTETEAHLDKLRSLFA